MYVKKSKSSQCQRKRKREEEEERLGVESGVIGQLRGNGRVDEY